MVAISGTFICESLYGLKSFRDETPFAFHVRLTVRASRYADM
jgi:hypothetical protein